ncbi:MAG TPA: ATP-binding protein [Candidatus Baltobacteraceae bacterium]|jgi:hypothetical protein|nr:ATP-binding protein [Candidatus Baltobacteraceae bacterium]
MSDEKFDNPYRPTPGGEPPALVGRDAELEAIRYAVGLTKAGGAAQPIVLIGLRGMGKTAVLRRCLTHARESGGIVLSAEASRELHLATILRQGLERAKNDVASIPKKLKDTFDRFLDTLPEASYELPGELGGVKLSKRRKVDESPLADTLESLNAEVRKHGRFLVFAVDEIQECPAIDLLTVIRLVHQTASTPEPILFLGAGLPESIAYLHKIRTYTERWRYFRLELLAKDETIRAIDEPAKKHGVTCEHVALERLAVETAGYPFFVQEYASATWIHHRRNRITLDDVVAVIPGVRKIINDGFYDGRFRRLTPRECSYVLAMNALGEGAHSVSEIAAQLGTRSEAVSSIRNQLVKKDVAYAPAGGLLEFRMPLTNRYIDERRAEFEKRARETPLPKE